MSTFVFWSLPGLVIYGVLVRRMLRWDTLDWTYVLMMPIACIAGWAMLFPLYFEMKDHP